VIFLVLVQVQVLGGVFLVLAAADISEYEVYEQEQV